MTFKKTHLYTTLAVLAFVSMGYVVSGLAAPLLHNGQEAQVLSKLSVGTPSANSLLTVKNGSNDARMKILPGSTTNKSLLLHANSISLGDIRVGSFSNETISTLASGLFGSGFTSSNWQGSLQYPTAKTGTDITAVAPQQSINVHGKVVMEGLKAPNAAGETDQLCVAPNGTLTRCSAAAGYKWVATGFSDCLNDQSAINNTISSLADYQNPQCTVVINDAGGATATASSGSVGFNTLETAIDKLKPQKAHAAIIGGGSGPVDSDGDPIDIEILCTPSSPSGGGGYSGKRVQGFECKSLNSCDVVADSFCTDSVGAKPVYEASCVVPASDIYGCQDGCHLNGSNQCVQNSGSSGGGSGPTAGTCQAYDHDIVSTSGGIVNWASVAGNNCSTLLSSGQSRHQYCAARNTQSLCASTPTSPGGNLSGVSAAGDLCCQWIN